MKKQSNLSRLLDYAGTYRILSYLSWMLAAAGALLAQVPFWYIWRILREVIEVAPNYENAVHVTHYGWLAVAFAFAAVLTYEQFGILLARISYPSSSSVPRMVANVRHPSCDRSPGTFSRSRKRGLLTRAIRAISKNSVPRASSKPPRFPAIEKL